MMTSLVLGMALTAPGAPIPKDSDPAPTGPAPWVLYLKSVNPGQTQVLIYKSQKVTQTRAVQETVDGKAVIKYVQEQVDQMVASYAVLESLNPKFTTASGTTLTTESVMKRAKDGLVVLVSADGKPVSKNWLRAMDPEAVIVTAEGLVSTTAPRPTVQVPTAAPRLVMLATGADGKVQIAYNPAGVNNGNMGNDFAFNGRMNRVVFVNNGNGVQQMFLGEDGGYYPNPTPVNAVAPIKGLHETKFEAYDLNGKSVSKDAALTRLNAGGFVLISGDSRVPDASYLKQFKGELLVLISPELLNVPTGSKATKATAEKPAVVPAPAVAPALVPAPALLPGKAIRIQPGVIRAVPLQVQPIQEVPAQPAPAPAAKPAPAVAPAPVSKAVAPLEKK